MSKHTPEPWEIRPPLEDPVEIIGQVDGGLYGIIQTVGGNDRANAKRIVECVNGCEGVNPAAVRELLEQSRIILAYIEGGATSYSDHDLAGIRAAIAKAEEGAE